MAYHEDLAGRAREVMPTDADVTERKMSGGPAFLLRGHMFAGIAGSELMVRIGYEAAQRALELDHVRQMDFTAKADEEHDLRPARRAARPRTTAPGHHGRRSCPDPHPQTAQAPTTPRPPLTQRDRHNKADGQVGWWVRK